MQVLRMGHIPGPRRGALAVVWGVSLTPLGGFFQEQIVLSPQGVTSGSECYREPWESTTLPPEIGQLDVSQLKEEKWTLQVSGFGG